MRHLGTAASVFFGLLATEAQASDYYIEGQFGAASPTQVENSDEIETESEAEFFGGLAIGKRFAEPGGIVGLNTYLEGNLTNRGFALHGLNTKNNRTAATGDLSTFGLYANLWIGYEFTPNFEIYAGGGPGVALVQVGDLTSTAMGVNDADDSDVAFSYNLGGGAMYSVSEDWAFGIGYRYASIPRYSAKSYEGELSSHAVMLGLRYKF